MNRRTFLGTAGLALSGATGWPETAREHHLPATDLDYQRSRSYVEETPIAEYHWASEQAYESFRDLKYGIRIHWGIYSITGQNHESWPYLKMSMEERTRYNQLYKTWNPRGFDADEWTGLFAEAGMKMFAFTSKHHEGFSMFDTKTRVRSRADWMAAGGPKIEDCDLAYSIMETPFRRDVVRELTAAAQKRNLKIDLYFSHPDWYDADFRPYGWHPLQVPSSPELWGVRENFWDLPKKYLGDHIVMAPDPTPEAVDRMVKRHRQQLTELLTHYGKIDMMCLDIFWGPKVWPRMRETILRMRELQPDVMLRARGIGNYGDYYTPEGFVPGSKENTQTPWFVIYPLGSSFSYEKDSSKYKGARWIVHSLIDAVAKGGNFMVGVGPDGEGRFHPTAVEQLKLAGEWVKVNGEGIFATRPREGEQWREGEDIRFTRTKDGAVTYCQLLSWPGRSVTLTSLPGSGAVRAHMVGYPDALRAQFDAAKGLTIEIPEALQDAGKRPCDYAWTLRIANA